MIYLVLVGPWAFLLSVITLGWILLHIQFGDWARAWILERSGETKWDVHQIRVVIPARNEARNIGPCLSSLTQVVDAGALEVLVIDDGSEDDTAEVASTFLNLLPGLRVLSGEPRPSGWSGKAWACHQGSLNCEREWLCFLDADVRLHSGTLPSALVVAKSEGLDLLSLFGTWELGSFWERLLIPAVGWFIRGAIQIDEVNAGHVAFANGQFLLFRTQAYEKMGGHEVVRETVLDDVGLAKAMHAYGGKLGLRYAPWSFTVRLYTRFFEIYRGYQKNLYEGMERKTGVALTAAAFVFVWTVGPYLSLVVAMFFEEWWLVIWSVVLCFCVHLFRYRMEYRDGRKKAVLVALMHPLSGLFLTSVILHSMMSRTVSWKGRTFEHGKSAASDKKKPPNDLLGG